MCAATQHLIIGSKCQIEGEDFVNFCGLLRKHKLYLKVPGGCQQDNELAKTKSQLYLCAQMLKDARVMT